MRVEALVPARIAWYREVTREQWKAFFATFLGWVLDGFDFTILTFVLVDIQKSFTVDNALAGALGTITLIFRLIGGVAAGTAADRWGRRGPLMVSILWFSVFAFLSGFSTSYAMLFALRALFGIGMGGEWAAGMPLALEHWPAHLRGIASGMLQSGYSWGFMLSSLVFQYIYPLVDTRPDFAWRVMFWIGIAPALLLLWIRTSVAESPVWLARQRHLHQQQRTDRASVVQIFQPGLRGVTLQCSLLMGAFMFSYYSITFWYPTWLRTSGLEPLRYLVALNLGGIVGNVLWGRLSETGLGRRGAVSLACLATILAIPSYVMVGDTRLLWAGALIMGVAGPGMWGVAPMYLTERFPTSARGAGPGFAYHTGAGLGSMAPTFIGSLQDRGVVLTIAMAITIAISSVLAAGVMWLGPETRGRAFSATDDS